MSCSDGDASKRMLKDGGESEMNYKVWKKKHLLARDGGRGLLSLLKGKVRGDLSIEAGDGLGTRSVSV